MRLFYVCVVLCLSRSLMMSLSPIQGVLPCVKWSWKWDITPMLQSRRKRMRKNSRSKTGHGTKWTVLINPARNNATRDSVFQFYLMCIHTEFCVVQIYLSTQSPDQHFGPHTIPCPFLTGIKMPVLEGNHFHLGLRLRMDSSFVFMEWKLSKYKDNLVAYLNL
jgi:hypothetical protein